MKTWDVFISHASEDKETIVEPLVQLLEENGISCWYDKKDIGWGDSIIDSINDGLKKSKYALVVLSENFISKGWTKAELNSMLNMEIDNGKKKVLPLVVGNEKKIIEELPLLRNKKYIVWDKNSSFIVDKLREVLSYSGSKLKNKSSYTKISALKTYTPLSVIKHKKKEESDKAKAEFKDILFYARDMFFKYKDVEDFALSNISLDLKYNEITALIGKNGSGKSTLLKIIAYKLFPTNGVVVYPEFFYENNNNCRLTIYNNIVYLPSELSPWRGSLLDNLYFTLSSQGVLGEDNIIEVESIIEQLSLKKHIDKKWDELSTGYKIRFSLAKIILQKPKLLILDEPLANLDKGMQNIFLNDLKDMMKTFNGKLSIIISSHHIKEIERIADNLLILNNGCIEYFGSIKDFEKDRKENQFELITDISFTKLKKSISTIATKIEDKGSSFIIYTDISIDSKKIINILMEYNIPINSFNDISKSTIKYIG